MRSKLFFVLVMGLAMSGGGSAAGPAAVVDNAPSPAANPAAEVPLAGAPDRAALLEGWAAHMANLDATHTFEQVDEDSWYLEDNELPYTGQINVVGTTVRPMEYGGFESGFSAFGIVEMELVELPETRRQAQTVIYWLNDRQMLYFLDEEQRWVNSAAYQQALAETFDEDYYYSPYGWVYDYGFSLFLIGVVIVAFIFFSRQVNRASAIQEEARVINQKALENIERSKKVQDESIAISRELRDIQVENLELLKDIRDALKSGD